MANATLWNKWLKFSVYFFLIACTIRAVMLMEADPDLWGHVLFGKALIEHGGLHATDPFSFTAHGCTWINHEWLTELVFWVLYDSFGDMGLYMLKLVVGLLIISLLVHNARGKNPLIIGVVLAIAMLAASPGFNIRPQVFSFLFFTVFIVILRNFFSGGKNLLYLLPPVTILWVQFHGGFLMGLAVLGLAAGWETLIQLATKEKRFNIKILWIWVVLSFLSPLVNPYGYKLPEFLAYTLSIPRAITEWAPLPLLDFSYWQVKLLMLVSLAVIVTKPKRIFTWEALGALFVMYAAIRHMRHLPFFALLAAPWLIDVIGEFAASFKDKHPTTELTKPTIAIVASALLLMGGFQSYKTVKNLHSADFRILVDWDTYPVFAVRYMKANNLQGNLILGFDWGEYAIWHLYPDMKVSIDGRFRTCYPESVIQDHFKGFYNPSHFHLLEKYPGDYLLAPNNAMYQQLAALKDSPWLYIYSDYVSILFMRDNEKNQEALARFQGPGFRKAEGYESPYFP